MKKKKLGPTDPDPFKKDPLEEKKTRDHYYE